MSLEDDLEDLKRHGVHLEPDLRLTPYHRRIVATEPLPGTKVGHTCELECGHLVQTFGRLSHAREGKVLCDQCRQQATPVTEGVQIFKVQRPVAALPEDMRRIYVYNRDRNVTFQGPMPERKIRELFPRGEYKLFWYGTFKKGVVELTEPAPWQEW